MRKAIDLIRSFFFALKYRKGGLKPELYRYETAVRFCKILKKAPPFLRNMIADGLKRHRTFEPDEGWKSSKEFYYNYFRDNPTVFKSRESIPLDSWITVISHEWPVKGERYSEYYVNWGGSKIGTYKVESYSQYDDETIKLHGDSYGVEYIKCRPATAEEIEEAKSRFTDQMNEQRETSEKAHLQALCRIEEDYLWLEEK